MSRLAVAVAGVALLLSASPIDSARRVLDDFDDPAGWTAAPSDGVKLTLSADTGAGAGPGGKSLRMDFDFGGHAGWAAARKAFPIRLPGNWAIDLRLKGETSPQTLEFKLLDRSGQNVWWSVRRPYEFPRGWTTLRIRKRQVSFAWGPGGGGELRDVGFIEITVTAATGGKGTVWLDELALDELPPATSTPPKPKVTATPQAITLDLGARRELGGLALDWDERDFPRRYAIELSDDGVAWIPRREISAGRGGRAFVYLPDSDARFARLKFLEPGGSGNALRDAAVLPAEASETPTAFLQTVARDAPRGSWPRSFVGQGLYWALVGVDGGRDEGLLSEDGALEAGRGGFSLEPYLWTGGKLLGWAQAEISHALGNGDLPIPSVTRRYPGGLELEITAFADGTAA
ncbi:MAG TPA: discoidin domain-containing protein, partial [Thermoanaerobaculia bacterium]